MYPVYPRSMDPWSHRYENCDNNNENDSDDNDNDNDDILTMEPGPRLTHTRGTALVLDVPFWKKFYK